MNVYTALLLVLFFFALMVIATTLYLKMTSSMERMIRKQRKF
ncbi:hypothetical protein [Methanohalophilus levihalophilus]|nr:hypothetical protein [Methanohalophilus levihalophilus]